MDGAVPLGAAKQGPKTTVEAFSRSSSERYGVEAASVAANAVEDKYSRYVPSAALVVLSLTMLVWVTDCYCVDANPTF